MTIVTETIVIPDGVPPSSIYVEYNLAGTNGAAVREAYHGTDTIVGVRKVIPTVVGLDASYSIDLPSNANIVPAGTAWKRTIRSSYMDGTEEYISVPTTGTLAFDDILTEAPASVATSTYSELDARVQVLEATSTIDGGDASSALTGSIDGGSA